MNAREAGLGDSWLRRLPWQARNPWQANVPMGFVLDVDGEPEGYHFVIAQPLWLDGHVVPALFALDLFVAPRWRGTLHSLALTRSVFFLAGAGPVFTTTANSTSEALWTRLGARPLPLGNVSLVRFHPSVRLAVAAAERTGLRVSWLTAPTHSKPPDPEPVDLRAGWRSEPIGPGHAAAAGLWAQVRSSFPLATERTEGFLDWRYASDSPGGVLIGLREAGGSLRAWYAYRLAERGERTRVRLFSVLDVVGRPDDREALVALGRDVLGRARASGAEVVEARGLRPEFRSALREGARMSERRLTSNPFLGKVRPPAPPAEDWHLVSGDGDGGFL